MAPFWHFRGYETLVNACAEWCAEAKHSLWVRTCISGGRGLGSPLYSGLPNVSSSPILIVVCGVLGRLVSQGLGTAWGRLEGGGCSGARSGFLNCLAMMRWQGLPHLGAALGPTGDPLRMVLWGQKQPSELLHSGVEMGYLETLGALGKIWTVLGPFGTN